MQIVKFTKDKNIDEVYKIEINHTQSTPKENIMYN